MALGPYLSEIVIHHEWLSRTTTRKVFTGTAQYGLVICLILVPFVGCNAGHTVALLVLGMFLYGFVTGGDVIIPAEVSTHFPATIYAAINMFSNFAGVISPMIVGMILEAAVENEDGTNDLKSRWDYVFFMAAAVVSVGTTIFILFGSSERQDFDRIDYKKNDDNTSTASTSSSL
jgi:MFS family permease